MPSSTSNFDQILVNNIPYRRLPEHNWFRQVVIALIATFLGLVLWELFARHMQHGTGKIMSAMDSSWAHERRKLDHPNHNHRVVLTGSSRLLYGADLNILEANLGHRPIQLSLPGTGPGIFVKDIVENTDFDGLIIVGVTPFLFNRFDKGAFGEAAMNRYLTESPSEWLGSQIHDFLAMNLAFVDQGFAIFELAKTYSQLPHREGSTKREGEGWKLGNFQKDRQADMWPPVEIAGSFEAQQTTNFWQVFIGSEPPPPPVLEDMAKNAVIFFEPLITTIRNRGGDIVFVRLPSSSTYLEFEQKSQYKSLVWEPMLKELNLAGIHSFDFPELHEDLDTPEWSHLNRESQDKWSSRVVKYLERVYQESRGVSLKAVLNKDSKPKAEE